MWSSMGAGIRDIVLFRRFVPENGGEYFGAIIFCIAMGLIASALRVYRSSLEAAERIERTKVCQLTLVLALFLISIMWNCT